MERRTLAFKIFCLGVTPVLFTHEFGHLGLSSCCFCSSSFLSTFISLLEWWTQQSTPSVLTWLEMLHNISNASSSSYVPQTHIHIYICVCTRLNIFFHQKDNFESSRNTHEHLTALIKAWEPMIIGDWRKCMKWFENLWKAIVEYVWKFLRWHHQQQQRPALSLSAHFDYCFGWLWPVD